MRIKGTILKMIVGKKEKENNGIYFILQSSKILIIFTIH